MKLTIIESFGLMTFIFTAFAIIWQVYQKHIILAGYTDKKEEKAWHKWGVVVKIAFSSIVGLFVFAIYNNWLIAFLAGLLFGFIVYASDWILNKIMGWHGDHRGKDNPLDKLPIIIRLSLIVLIWVIIIFVFKNN